MIIPKQPYLVHAEFASEPSGNQGENLVASIRFGDGEQKLVLGTIRFRVSEIYLTLSCENCTLSPEHWLFRGDVDRAVKAERTMASNSSVADEQGAEGSGEISKSPKFGAKQSSKHSRASGAQMSVKLDHEIATVYAQGGGKAPKWRIKAPIHSRYLQGTLCEGENFARSELIGAPPGAIKAIFKIPRSGLTFESENQISGQYPNKSGFIRHIIRLLITERDYAAPVLEIGR